MTDTEPVDVLETGWDRTTPDGDTIVRQAIDGSADRVETVTEALAGTVRHTEHATLARCSIPHWFLNVALLRRPLESDAEAAQFHDEVEAFFPDGPFVMMSPFPVPAAVWSGWQLVGHPPFMVRPRGPSTVGRTDADETVEEVTSAEALAEFEQTLIEAYPMELPEPRSQSLLPPSLLGGSTRFFVARDDGAVVATAYVHIAHGVSTIEFVSTRVEVRRRGFGAAVTNAAALAEPSMPSVLIASDPGRPTYERLGYIPISRWTLAGRL